VNVLIIEDDASFSDFLVMVLEARGHTVSIAPDAEQGLLAYERADFPLVVLDLILPGMDGLDLCRRIRQAPGGDETLILVSTVREGPEDLQAILAAGADDYLPKPVDHHVLDLRLTVAEQITRLKINESKRHQRENNFQKLVESANAVFWRANLDDWQFVYVSPHAERLFGYSVQDWYSQNFWVDHIHPNDREDAVSYCKTTTEKGEDHEFEYRMIASDGREIWVKDIVSVNRQPGYLTGFLVDITKQREFEQELIYAKQQAEEASEAKSMFLAKMNHELRTPLNSILGFGQLIQMDTESPVSPKHTKWVEQILKAGWHQLDIVNDLLDLASIEAGKLEIHMEPVDLAPQIDYIVDAVTIMSSEHSISVNIADDLNESGKWVVQADRVRLRQALLNLISNSIKYNIEDGAVSIAIEEVAGNRLRIEVRDTGSGISTEDLEVIFDPFSRPYLKGYALEGTGVGLSITRQLVDAMGGAIGVESTVGKGSTFWIEFGKAIVPASPPEITDEIVSREGTEVTTILYVEDSPAHVQLMETLIEELGNIRLFTAHTGKLGIDMARAHQPDLIILDICLPDVDGFSLLKQIQACESIAETPVIALSANAMPKKIEAALDAGFRRYLTKPLDVVKFHNTITTLLENNRAL